MKGTLKGTVGMPDTNSFLAQVDTLRKQTLGVLDDLTERADRYDLPKPPELFDTYRQRLRANRYVILVAGEVSTGKSKFVNALIGRDLLPQHEAVTTKQVFHVTNAHQESYRLRFVDDRLRPIHRDELSVYGSETESGRRGSGDVDQAQLKWIEVEVPCRLLPSNVSLLDTPGLGALYAAHAEITQRFIPLADGVIFVLDSRNGEMGQTEKDYIETILKFTKHIFFIQTHIDLFDEATWREIQDKNQAILRRQFGKSLDDTRVWPISSTNMLSAAQSADPEYLDVYRALSRQEELLPALEEFLFAAAGWFRCADALRAASGYYVECRKLLVHCLNALRSSPEQRIEVQQSETQLRQFSADWGTQGQKRRELEAEVRRIVSSNKRRMLDLLKVGAGTERMQRNKIDALTSVSEADRLAKVMSEQVITEVVDAWRSVCDEANQQCVALLLPLVKDAEALLPHADDPNLVTRIRLRTRSIDELREYIVELPDTFLDHWQAVYLLLVVAAPLIHITGGLLLAGAAIAGVWGVARRIRFVKATHLAEAQEKLHDDLSDLMGKIREGFQQPDAMYGDKSLINYHFDRLTSEVYKAIEKFVERKRAEAESEHNRIEALSRLDEHQRAIKERELGEQVEAWDTLGNTIEANLAQLKALKGS